MNKPIELTKAIDSYNDWNKATRYRGTGLVSEETIEKKFQIYNEESTKLDMVIMAEEGRATARTLLAREILDTINEAERKYSNIAKKYKDGLTIYADVNAQSFPRAYKYTPESTHFAIEFKKGKWYLKSVARERCTTRKYEIVIPDAMKAEIIKDCETNL